MRSELTEYVDSVAEISELMPNYNCNYIESVWIRSGCKLIGQNSMLMASLDV